MPDAGQVDNRDELGLPRGHYYWDGRSLHRVDQSSVAFDTAAEADPSTRSQVAINIETVAICSFFSVVIAVLTWSWDKGPMAGMAHALALLPILLIDRVYRWVSMGQINVGRTWARVWKDRQATAIRSQRPWWLRAIFYIALIAVCLELLGYLWGPDADTRLGATEVVDWLLMLPFGVLIALTGGRRKTTLAVVAVMTLPVLSLIDPLFAPIGGRGGLFGTPTVSDLRWEPLVEFVAALILSPIPLLLAFIGYVPTRMIRWLGRPKDQTASSLQPRAT